jgi:hypothetical protein
VLLRRLELDWQVKEAWDNNGSSSSPPCSVKGQDSISDGSGSAMRRGGLVSHLLEAGIHESDLLSREGTSQSVCDTASDSEGLGFREGSTLSSVGPFPQLILLTPTCSLRTLSM